jgi:hypothetical protein
MKTILFILIGFVALTASISGLLLMSNPDGAVLQLSLKLLEGTTFHDYFIPGIMLTILVGSTNLFTVWLLIRRDPTAYNWSLAAGIILCAWVIAQIIVLRAVHWMHFMYFVIGLMIALLAFQLKGKWMV